MDNNKVNKPKGFFARLLDRLDKKMEEKSRSQNCGCCGSKNKEDRSCCK
ncbi:MAG: hypothetical protein WCY12_02930 [Candidatus Omnitrophota bacterium]